jgi:hypothetical protein
VPRLVPKRFESAPLGMTRGATFEPRSAASEFVSATARLRKGLNRAVQYLQRTFQLAAARSLASELASRGGINVANRLLGPSGRTDQRKGTKTNRKHESDHARPSRGDLIFN